MKNFLLLLLLFAACTNKPATMSHEDSMQTEARYKEVTENNPNTNFLKQVKSNTSIIDAAITDVNFLYISVYNDGTNKDAMAAYYCRLAKDSSIDIAGVKIVDAATAKIPHDGTATGTVIGKAFCK